jgi:hypothetical protein
MQHVTNQTEQAIAGTYGHLTVEYRRLRWTWTVTVYQRTLRIDELCQTFDNAHAAYREAQRIARAAHEGQTVAEIAATKPGEMVLAAVKSILDTVPTGEHRQVRPTMAGAHLADLEPAQLKAIQLAAGNTRRTVYVGQVTRPTLRALARKGYGTLNHQPGMGRRQVIDSLTLNARGITEATRV